MLPPRAGPLDGIIGKVGKIAGTPLNEGKKKFAQMQAGDYSPETIRAYITDLTDRYPVVVFTWPGCPYCVKARRLLAEVGANYHTVELDKSHSLGKAIRAELGQMTNRTSMPNIFIGGKSYGGCNDGPGLVSLIDEGIIIPLLQRAGGLNAY